ncbi:tautomerase family protein [Streptomyces sp. NPDC006879]|uniref:tautomerase family protein n=1 Tax=Streptomyces sp. NPDC006879 TaxID=3364767 RepID=UPI0036C541FE
MPHVNIKYFPKPLDAEQQARLVARVAEAVREAFEVEDRVISVSLQPVEPELWDEEVYQPEIVDRRDLLAKSPEY